ncbi:MAG TPA: phosphatase PAP2 family protein [Mycobacteriales bacterium]|jgi:undecaprenyl-diphosphatase|nr:phosphatase PAP2 family protein [Mycobacteriales bacterium]
MRGGLPDVVRRRLDPRQRFGLRATLLAVAVLLVAVPFGLLLEQVVRLGPVDRADKAMANDLHEVACTNAALVSVARVVSFLGSTRWLTGCAVVGIVVLVARGERRLALFAAVTTGLGGALNSIAKALVSRPRPTLDGCELGSAHGLSFPSGHAMGTTIVYGTLLLVGISLVARRWRPLLIGAYAVWLTAMALSRMTLGVHYLSDVIGGIALGLAWLAAATSAFEIWRQERGRRRTHPLEEGMEPEARARQRVHAHTEDDQPVPRPLP